MRMFLAGVIAAIAIAVVTGFVLESVEIDSAQFNSTEDVRF